VWRVGGKGKEVAAQGIFGACGSLESQLRGMPARANSGGEDRGGRGFACMGFGYRGHQHPDQACEDETSTEGQFVARSGGTGTGDEVGHHAGDECATGQNDR
jgi:hypothetical protein